MLVAVRQEGDVPSPLDRTRYLSLVLGTGARPAARAYPGMFGNEGAQKPCILPVDDLLAIDAERALLGSSVIPTSRPPSAE